jgi:hypothetical protein
MLIHQHQSPGKASSVIHTLLETKGVGLLQATSMSKLTNDSQIIHREYCI